MKGLIATTLMFCLTGMVSAQQTASQFDTGSSRTTSNRLGGSGANQSTARSTTADRQTGPLLLDLNDDFFRQLVKEGKPLTSVIEPAGRVDGIVIRFDGVDAIKPPTETVPENFRPSLASGDHTLHFTIDDAELLKLTSEGLRYSYRPDEVGKFDTITLTYKGTQTDRNPVADSGTGTRRSLLNDRDSLDDSTHQPISTVNSVTQRRPRKSSVFDDDFGSPRDNTSDSNSTATDDYFARKRQREEQTRREAQARLDEQARREERARRDREHGIGTTHDSSLAGTGSQRRRSEPTVSGDRFRGFGNSFNRQNDAIHSQHPNHSDYLNEGIHDIQLTDGQIDALARATEQRNAEVEALRLQNERLAFQLRDRNRLDDQPVATRRSLDEGDFYTGYQRRPLSPVSARFNRTASLDERITAPTINTSADRNRDRDYGPTRTSQADRLAMERKEYENERLRLELARVQHNARLDAADPLNATTPASRFTGPLNMRDLNASIPGNRTPPSNRVASANVPLTQTIVTRGLVASIDPILKQYNGANYGTNYEQIATQVRQEYATIVSMKNKTDKTNGFLWFLMLFFFSLSLYLAWLAQGFYARYGELAEELRETFTATT